MKTSRRKLTQKKLWLLNVVARHPGIKFAAEVARLGNLNPCFAQRALPCLKTEGLVRFNAGWYVTELGANTVSQTEISRIQQLQEYQRAS